MKSLFFIVIISFLIAFACIKEKETDNLPLHKAFELVKGSEKSSMEGISVVFNTVTEDSRCPLDVNCIWEGTASARFTFSGNITEPVSFILHINSDTIINGYRINLVDLKPYPISTIQTDPEKYIAEILVTKE